VQASATLGLVRLREHDGNGADALKDADIALKRAKTQQRGGHFYFSRGMGVEIRERVRLMHALRGGFARGELFLAYQPQIDLATRRPFGAEALLRWRTEDGTHGPADRFIPIAEYSGLIIEIGAWVLREACPS
jgi:predicted signal transduction protein with EAL and GGDEF domain